MCININYYDQYIIYSQLHFNITDEYRVRTDIDHIGKGPMADYLLKVYDEEIRLFSSNGKLPTDFSCDLKEIHKIKYLYTKKNNGYLSIVAKNAKSKYAISLNVYMYTIEDWCKHYITYLDM